MNNVQNNLNHQYFMHKISQIIKKTIFFLNIQNKIYLKFKVFQLNLKLIKKMLKIFIEIQYVQFVILKVNNFLLLLNEKMKLKEFLILF